MRPHPLRPHPLRSHPARNHLAAIFSLVVAGLATAQAPTAVEAPFVPDFAANLTALQNELVENDLTGSNIVLVGRDGEQIFRSIRNSGRQGDRDITDDTLFPIWSMSKPITIVAMMTLHEKGLFDWNDPVSKYIPCFADLAVKDGETVRPARTPLRVIDLMTHRSGYAYYPLFPGVPARHDQPQQSQTKFEDLQEFCELAADYPLEFDPGTDYAYGINQAILGRLVEVLSGRPFGAYLEEAIFEPLGMTETSFVLDDARRARFQPLFVNIGDLRGYTNLLDELNYAPDSKAHFGGEGLVSNPADYARFCEMLAAGGEFGGERILSAESMKKMTTVYSEDIFPELMPGMDMGFSVFVVADPETDGTRAPKGVFGWSGYHNTHFFVDPGTNAWAVFMSRSRDFNFDLPRRLREAVYGASTDAP